MLNWPDRRGHVLNLHSGVGSRIPGGDDKALDAIVEFGHRLHVVGLEQIKSIDRTQSEIGERDRMRCGAAVTGSFQATVQAM